MDREVAEELRSSGLILVVDDEPRVRESIRSILEDEGFVVIAA